MAQDNDKRPQKPFNVAAQKPEVEIVFEADIDLEEDDEPLRSNTDPKHDPANVKNPSLTPSGTGNFFPPPRSQDQWQTPSQPATTEKQPSDDEWQHALRNGNHTLEGEFNGFRVRAWRAEHPTKDGYEGGHLNKIVVTQGEYGHELEVAHFKDGDWEKQPEATPERQAVMDAVQEYDGEFFEEQRQKEEQEIERQHDINAKKDKGKSR
ncbi:hypothetical protein [Thalassobius sp. Cn5-15]|uniref:hypothetical protein n=1 Tax=Thalassobius sp. Cn5-15 TaxID=2917763 RepID=UPI001EF16802|nr:hypothetical protein [Thalassobius sp. Cn5-15]MCG7492496.1 hypothetical protein [Thalassobius sp. Cn5-15]